MTTNKFTSFGVGCFHFGVSTKAPHLFRHKAYAEDIEQFLRSLDTVEDFSVNLLPYSADDEYELRGSVPSLSEGELFPSQALSSVDFSLRIPPRAQRAIANEIEGAAYSWDGLGTERFRIRTEYFYHAPVTVVECLDMDERGPENPSDAVWIVREYLASKLEESTLDLQMQIMGPSPFHADFFVCLDETDGSEEQIKYDKRLGYDVVDIRLSSSDFRNAVHWFFNQCGDQLSMYYWLKCIQRRRSTVWLEIQHNWNALHQSLESENGIRRRLDVFGKRRKIEELVNQVMRFRANTMFRYREASSSHKNLLAKKQGTSKFWRENLTDTFDEAFSEYPTAEVLELAKFYESRDAKWRDRVYFLLAALVGGAVGAVITQWWRSP